MIYFTFESNGLEVSVYTNDDDHKLQFDVTDFHKEVNIRRRLNRTELAELKGMIDVIITNLNEADQHG